MELEGVLGIKPTQIHLIQTMEQARRCRDASWRNEIKKVIFFLLMPHPRVPTFWQFTVSTGSKNYIFPLGRLYKVSCSASPPSLDVQDFIAVCTTQLCTKVVFFCAAGENFEILSAFIDFTHTKYVSQLHRWCAFLNCTSDSDRFTDSTGGGGGPNS